MKLILFILIFLSCSRGAAEKKIIKGNAVDLEKTAMEIHRKIFTLDSHTDTPITLLNPGFDISKKHEYDFNGPKVDFPRMKEGGLDGIFFAIFVRQGPLDKDGFMNAGNHAYKMFMTIKKTVSVNPGLAGLALSSHDALVLHENSKISIFIGIENGYSLGMDLSLIQKYYGLGARYITLCHTSNNQICDSSTDPRGPEHNGLSPFGRKVVAEMYRTGMIIDVSHISDKSFYDIIETAERPLIASHSNARSICNHPRNLTDDMIRAMAKNRGVINVSLWSGYVQEPEENQVREMELKALNKKYSPNKKIPMAELQKFFAEERAIIRKYSKKKPSLSKLIDHIDHIKKIAGIDHIGIGSDFDGGGGLEGCLDVSRMGNITLELLKRGYGEGEIKKIWGENMMRVMNDIIK